jgi:hypothetical protein
MDEGSYIINRIVEMFGHRTDLIGITARAEIE